MLRSSQRRAPATNGFGASRKAVFWLIGWLLPLLIGAAAAPMVVEAGRDLEGPWVTSAETTAAAACCPSCHPSPARRPRREVR